MTSFLKDKLCLSCIDFLSILCYLNLTYKQFEAIQFRNQGYTNREIAKLCGVGRKAIEKRFARIRKILSDYKEN